MEAPGGKGQIDDQHWLIPSAVIIALIIVGGPSFCCGDFLALKLASTESSLIAGLQKSPAFEHSLISRLTASSSTDSSETLNEEGASIFRFDVLEHGGIEIGVPKL